MEHVRNKAHLRQRLQHRPAEIGIPFALVAAQAVDIIALEILLVVHEIERDVVIHQLFNAHVLTTPAQIDIEEHHVLHLVAPFLVDGGIQGQYHAHILAGFANLLGQCAHHVRQSAGFHKGYAFGCCKQYFHFDTS